MLNMVTSLYRAIEEGLYFRAIAERFPGRPDQMAEAIRAALGVRYTPGASTSREAVDAEIEEAELAAA